MKCDDKSILQFLEGRATAEIEAHIKTCETCCRAAEELSLYKKVLPYYREGRRLLDDLDKHMESFNETEARRLPPRIEELLRQTGKEGADDSDRTAAPFERPRKKASDASGESVMPLAMAAIPKDLTRPKKGKGREKKE
jgi:hypothetical protein